MKNCFLSLGTIVLTDFRRSVSAFQDLSDTYGLEMNIEDLLPRLVKTFNQFSHGQVEPSTFVAILREHLCGKYPVLSEKVKGDEIIGAWNAMCVVDDETIALLKGIEVLRKEHPDLRIEIYSEINPFQYEYIDELLKSHGLSLEGLWATCQHKMSKDALLEKILKETGRPGTILFMGSTEHLSENVLKENVVKRDDEILKVAKDLQIVRLTQPRISMAVLNSALESDNPQRKLRCSV